MSSRDKVLSLRLIREVKEELEVKR